MNLKKIISFALSFAILVGSFVSCGKAEPHSLIPEVTSEIDDDHRVFYEIFVGSFSDSNEDGCGDLRGIINRMDYLNDGDVNSEDSLGVQGIWLSPILKSPSYHKYDVADYYTIDEQFGTEKDLEDLITICHERNVKVIMDLVINHSSDRNPLFEEFTRAHVDGDTDSVYYDFYSWATASTKIKGSTYMQIPGLKDRFYECNFASDMPELNFDNDAVRNKVLDIAKFWLDKGIDGFRFDAVKYIYYNDTSRSVDFWEWYMDELRAYKPDIYCVGECWSSNTETVRYAGAFNCFDFESADAEGRIAKAAKGGNIDDFTQYIVNNQKSIASANSSAMEIPFITNHDMDRAAGTLIVSQNKMSMAANLYLLCNGSPFIYYGEETGLKGSRGGAGTDANRRLAMLWGDWDTVSDPIGSNYPISSQVNGTVYEQMADEESLFHYYCRLIKLRNAFPEIARGAYTQVSFGQKNFGGFLIEYQGDSTWLFHNTSDEEITIDLSDTQATTGITELKAYIGQGSARLKGTRLTVGPKTSVILK